jgi:bacteriorhodopsin
METASFNGFIKVIFYTLAFYYIFRFLARLFLPVLAKKVVEKASQQFQQQQQNAKNQNDNQQAATSKSDKPKEKKKVGEYVDFEEIE